MAQPHEPAGSGDKAKIAAARAEHKRLAQEKIDNDKAQKERKDREKKKKADLEKVAKSLEPNLDFQQETTTRLTTMVTDGLARMFQVLLARPNQEVQWISAAFPVARDVMQRAYPMGLQMNIRTALNDTDHTLTLMNGSRVEFWWPGKKPILSRFKPAREPEPEETGEEGDEA